MASHYPDHILARRRHSLAAANVPENHSYPPQTPYERPDSAVSASTLTVLPKSDTDVSRDVNRTPSPTPSEARELKTGAIDWKALTNWRFWLRKEWAWYYVAIIIIVTITALVSIFHKEIVQWLKPAATWLHQLPFGWLVPIGVLFVISFPPLFGHEIVAILCGLVWGLWIGFGIVAAGTFLGEVGNFYAFKYCCRARGVKLERSKLSYACLAKVVRDGGFKIALVARLSAIPGHFTTAVFSTCGMGIFVFSLAAILSLPKQFITVYLGVILEQSETGQSTKSSRLISNIVLAVTVLITIAAMWYILHRMNKVKPEIIYARRKARQAKLMRAASLHPTMSETTLAGSTVEVDMTDSGTIPLKTKSAVYAPQPQRPSPYTNPHDIHDESEHFPDSYAYAEAQRHRHGREDSVEVGWDMAPPGSHPTVNPAYSPVPPGLGVNDIRSRHPTGALSSDSPYMTSHVTASPPQVPVQTLPPENRPQSMASHIITFDPDAVSVSSAPHTPDLTLPTPPFNQKTFNSGSLSASSSYPPQPHPPTSQASAHRQLSPFRDPVPLQAASQSSTVQVSRSTPNLTPTAPGVQQQSYSLHNSPEVTGQSTPAFALRSNSRRASANGQPPSYEQAYDGVAAQWPEPANTNYHTTWDGNHSLDQSDLR